MSTDAEMIRVLQVNRDDVPEALKTLQRALEKERDREIDEKHLTGVDEEDADEEEGGEDETDAGTTMRTASTKGYAGALRLGGLKRRLTMDSVVTKASRKSKTSKKGSRWSMKTDQSIERDTLDREFIETGIDALRRLSKGQDLNLPNWTITR